ncbi:MAG: Gfo/Idh/MocA family protein [Nitrospinota bacterium]
MEEIRAGIVGLGKWAEAIAAAVGRSEGIALTACASSDPEKARAFGDAHGCAPFETYASMLADPDVRAVLVASANPHHAGHAVAAAEAGKHVFVEKPIATTLPEARRVLEAAERAGVVLATGQLTRRMTGVRKMKALMEEGALGRVVMAEGNFSYPTGYNVTPDNWRWSNETCPGGALIQLGIHHADALAYLLGEIARVQSVFRRAVVDTEIDTVTATLLEFESGAVGYLGSNFVSASLFTLDLHGTEANAYFRVEQDAFPWGRSDRLDEHSLLEIQRRGSPDRTRVPLDGGSSGARGDVLREELEEFGRCVREGGRPEVGGREGLAALGVVLAAFRSAREGRVIDFREFIR